MYMWQNFKIYALQVEGSLLRNLVKSIIFCCRLCWMKHSDHWFLSSALNFVNSNIYHYCIVSWRSVLAERVQCMNIRCYRYLVRQFLSHFSGLFEGASNFLTPQKVPWNSSKIIVTKKTHYVTNFLKQQDIGNFMSFCNHLSSIL